ncbi:hypothetical protein PC121_g10115 [Phytophthora cactorum]|nr:hypothetical protein PC120_g11135 [Phytophthora cactorum]KAG3068687.1 hypothetical protein PC121_g10115 [Phytophthora cactorum]
MPLSEVDHPTTRSMFRLKPISSKTLKKYLAATTRAVKKEIAKAIPPIFYVMYDGWTCFSEHYVALYIVFWKDGQLLYILLAVAPLGEADLTAASQFAYVRNILTIFGQSEESLKFLVGGNCATNQLTATLLGAPLRGERTDGDATDYQEPRRAPAPYKLDVIGCECYAVELRLHEARAVVRIRDPIKRVDAVYDLASKPAAHTRIAALFESLKTFNSVCKKLQEDSISMIAVRLLFDTMVEIFPVTGDYRRHHRPFSGFSRYGSWVDGLTPEELQALHPFELEAAASEPTHRRVVRMFGRAHAAMLRTCNCAATIAPDSE